MKTKKCPYCGGSEVKPYRDYYCCYECGGFIAGYMMKFADLVNALDEEQKKLKDLLKEMTFIDPYDIIDNTEMTTLDDFALMPIVPACCKHGCEVEPDGYCEHGNPSILIEVGLI